MNKLAKWATCLAAAMTMGCAKTDYWADFETYETVTLGYDDAFFNITAPGSVANITVTENGRTKQYGYNPDGENLLTMPYAYNFVSNAQRLPVNPTQTTTDFWADNKYSVFKMKNKREKKIYSFEPKANALVRFKGNGLSGDSLNNTIVGHTLQNSQWRNN